ncbi:MAG: hypothetical protein R3F37_07305 [Candidatus Competibacteraceae bacterium]
MRDIIRKRIKENRRRLDEMLALQERSMEQALALWNKLPDGVPDCLVCAILLRPIIDDADRHPLIKTTPTHSARIS